MTNVQLFFAFADNALSFDCADCDQRCCKTGGLSLLGGERDVLMRCHPALELVAPSHTGPVEVFHTPKSGCWFLYDKACGFLVMGTDTLKEAPLVKGPRPMACALYPFNSFALLDEVLVVLPHGLCPLKVVPQGQGVQHEVLAQELSQLGAAGDVPIILNGAPDDKGATSDRLNLEQVVRDAASACVHNREATLVPLLAFMEVAFEAYSASMNAGKAFDPERIALDHMPQQCAALDSFMTEAAEILSIAEPTLEASAQEHVVALMSAFLPALRLVACDGLPLYRIPRTLAVLQLYLEYWVALRPERTLLPQTIMQMANALLPTAHMLSAWHEPFMGATVQGILSIGKTPAQSWCDSDAHEKNIQERALILRHMARAFQLNADVEH